MRGGVLEHIYMRDVTIGQVADAVVHVDFHYEEGAAGSHLPTVRDIEVRNVTSRKSEHALYLRGFANAPITDIRVIDCRFDQVAKGNLLEHVTRLEMRNVRINGELVQ